MKCTCGETEIEYTMAAGPIHLWGGAEIGPMHTTNKSVQCGFGYECQDCWGDYYASGQSGGPYPTEAEAIEALNRHIDLYCPPNWKAKTDAEKDEALVRRASWERYCSTRSSRRYAQALADGFDG